MTFPRLNTGASLLQAASLATFLRPAIREVIQLYTRSQRILSIEAKSRKHKGELENFR